MKFILNKQLKHCTKETLKWIRYIAIALFIIFAILFLKYNLVCEVSISGEKVGYVKNKSLLDNKIQTILDQEGTENIAFVDLPEDIEYKLTFISDTIETNDNEVLAKIEENTKITYVYYAVDVNNEQTAIVNSLEEAETLVAEVKQKYEKSTKFTIGITEVYSENQSEYKVEEISVAKKNVTEEVKEIKSASVNGVYLAQKPVSGVITSRFGSRESIRTHAHTGLDIAAPYGTDIKAAADGTVKFSGDNGSYGNLVIINCGNGVEIYYGHCSKLLVNVGDKIKAGDVIAEVGSTGNSTGNHLHFEIRVNGSQVNPQRYIYK